MSHLWKVLIAVITYVRAHRVKVQIFIESGCPFCSRYLTSPLTEALADDEVASRMDVDVSPFGNAYYLLEKCKSVGANSTAAPTSQYDTGLRDCFYKTCGAGVANRPADCFSGQLVCQ